MSHGFDLLLTRLKSDISSVQGLVTFDKMILDLCIKKVKSADQVLSKTYVLENHPLRLSPILKSLENIRKHESTEINYKTIYNQALVLLISYFSRSLEDLFDMHIEDRIVSKPIDAKKPGKLDEISICVSELVSSSFDLKGRIGRLIIDKNGYNFQNMGSIKRAFSDFYDHEIEQDSVVNNLIVATELRHCIVHTGTFLDERNFQRILKAKAVPRSLKLDLRPGMEIEFSPQEIALTSENMVTYIERLFETGIRPFTVGVNGSENGISDKA